MSKQKIFLQFLVVGLLGQGLWFGPTNWAHGDDIDDIEAGMETAISESEAAQSAAVEAQRREKEEQANLVRARKEATREIDRAKAREVSARKEIKILTERTNVARAERERQDRLKAEALKKIAALDEKVNAQKLVLEKAQAELETAKNERQVQDEILARKVEEQRQIEKEIVKDRDATKSYLVQMDDLKKKSMEMESKLVRLRENARREADKKEKAEQARDSMKRKVSSVPTKVIFRAPRYNCDVTDVASDGATVIGHIKRGTKYELYRIANKRWVEMQFGQKKGFAPRTCF